MTDIVALVIVFVLAAVTVIVGIALTPFCFALAGYKLITARPQHIEARVSVMGH